MLKLPKNVLSHPRVEVIEALFCENMRPLHNKGLLQVPLWSFSEGFCAALQKVYETKHLVQGFEAIEKHLDKELKGLNALKKLPGQTQNQRLSRLVILSNDGSERFYHNAESVLLRHADRVLAVTVGATSAQLGGAFTKKANPAKALLITERKALETFLIVLAERS